MKLPAFQFYPGDWRKDPGIQSLSFHDRGVWFEILCLMHESSDRGKLLLGGLPMPEDALSRLLGLDKQNLTKTLTTLVEYGVVSREPGSGALFSRRMVRDEEIRRERQKAGKLGGNPALLNQKPKQKPTTQDNQKPTPSSSASFSASAAEEPPVALGHERNRSMPPILESIPGFRDAWERWMVDLSARNRGKSPTIFQLQMHLAKLTKIAEAGQSPIEAIDNGIARALREPDLPLKGSAPAPRNEPPPTRISE